ncbi:MAG: sugar ABC transporter ATP-binding protein [Chloroflexi bacterium]|nr:sugar ABC transporter ATP-binding protein [Chloroflexota bacterium]
MEELLRLENLTKTFPEVVALKGVNFSVMKGEVHALVGENGAGKSTLVKIVSGVERMDHGGALYYKGNRTEICDPHSAQKLGISVIYQELTYVPELTVAENIFLGREPVLAPGIIDWKTLRAKTRELLSRLDIRLEPDIQLKHLSTAQRQMVEIAKALSLQAEIIFMDEPTASLTEHEIRTLFKIIRELKSSGVTIVYISHHLEEILEISDRVTVLRDGEWIATRQAGELDIGGLISMMVGRDMNHLFPPRTPGPPGEEILRVENLNRGESLRNISFSLKQGEILGFAGLVGAGRTEVARAIFGADPPDSGEIRLKGKPVSPRSPQEALKCGIALVPEDRKEEGLVLSMSVEHNITLGNLNGVCRGNFFINHAREKQVVDGYIKDLQIKTPLVTMEVRRLSGGNQQKVVVAKWLFIPSYLIIFDEPTRGIDVKAKYELYELMYRLVQEGIGVIIISSELPELIGICDRILVMHEGEITGELVKGEFSQEKIMEYATGGAYEKETA